VHVHPVLHHPLLQGIYVLFVFGFEKHWFWVKLHEKWVSSMSSSCCKLIKSVCGCMSYLVTMTNNGPKSWMVCQVARLTALQLHHTVFFTRCRKGFLSGKALCQGCGKGCVSFYCPKHTWGVDNSEIVGEAFVSWKLGALQVGWQRSMSQAAWSCM
jgi:hypothetical protein